MDKLSIFNKAQVRIVPDIRPGDTVKIYQKFKEGDKKKIQSFEGIVIARKHGKGISATITVRKISFGVGVEKIMPIYSPTIDKIEIVRRAKVKRAKLYYIREKAAKEIRKKMKGLRKVAAEATTESPTEEPSVENNNN